MLIHNLVATGSAIVSGSSTITGDLTVLGSISGTISGSVNNAISASYAINAGTAANATNATNAITAQTASYADSFTVAGTLTAQKLVVQTITSSIVYSSGSNILGNNISNTQVMTGSVSITGSLTVNGTGLVPYTGATADVDLGGFSITPSMVYISGVSTGGGGVLNIKKDTTRTVGGADAANTISVWADGATLGFNDFVAGNLRSAKFSVANITNNATRTYTLPNSDGTLALTSNLSAYLPLTGGTLTGDLTISKSTSPSLFLTNTSSINYRLISKDDGNFVIQRTGIADLVTVNPSGNLGLGVTPSAWGGSRTALQIGNTNSYFIGNQNTVLGNNAYNDGSSWRYLTNYNSTLFNQSEGGQFQWFTAPSGTAGNAISFTQAMTLDASGRLGIGTTSPVTTLTLKSTNDNGYALTRPSNDTTLHWRLSTTESGGDAYTVRYNTFNNEMLFTTYAGGGTGGNIIWRTGTSGAGSETERMRITSGGNVLIGSTTDNGARFEVKGGYTAFQYNSSATGPVYPSYNTYFGAIGTNFSNGGSELDIWNTVGGGFVFRKQTATSAQTALMTITSGGNVGIGTTSPASFSGFNGLTINGTSGSFTQLQFNSTNATRFSSESGFTAIYEARNAFMIFGTSDTERMRITSGGNVGIGTTSPGFKLSVVGSGNVVGISSSDNSLSLALGYQGVMHGYLGGFNSRLEAYSNNGGYVLLNASSVWVAASDAKRKRNFEPYTNGLSAILGLNPKLYNMDFQKDGDEKQVGLVAQEVNPLIPKAYNDNNGFIGLDYNAITVTLINAIKELNDKIKLLENK
jgi:hypothetical protein